MADENPLEATRSGATHEQDAWVAKRERTYRARIGPARRGGVEAAAYAGMQGHGRAGQL